MGFYSWQCRGCSESVKAPYDLPKALEWQNDIVALQASSELLQGRYDGYGRVVTEVGFFYERSRELWVELPYEGVEYWHHRCWKAAGSPKSYTAVSLPAEDQGFFYVRSGPEITDRLAKGTSS